MSTEKKASQNEKNRNEPNSGRTPGRKLVKEDITTTSVLIRGCSIQTCCGKLCPTAAGDLTYS
jgi:hypothetical protein